MITLKKAGTALLFSALLSAALASGVMAASRSKVGKITLTFETDIRPGRSGGEVEVTPSGSNTDLYYIDSVEVINDEGEDWTRSNPPVVEVVLGVEDEEEYYFGSQSSSSFKLNLDRSIKGRFDEVDFVEADREDDNATLILTAELVIDKDADKSQAPAPSGVKWTSDSTASGVWNEASAAKYYQVQLFRGDTSVSSIEATYDTSFDFTRLITEAGTYQFKVRSVKDSNNSKSSWSSSGSLTISAEEAAALGNPALPTPGATEGWQRAADGIRWWWQNPDGSYPASAWMENGGKWYYFDAQGYMLTGWIEADGLRYYLDTETGAMYANQRTPDNQWVNESGAWVPGA